MCSMLLSLAAFVVHVRPSKILSHITPAGLGLPFERISFATSDGFALAGWLIPHVKEKDVPTIVLLHGYPADKGNILPVLSFLAPHFNLFLFDFRALGESGGSVSTLGAREVDDFRAALRYLRLRDISEVGVFGFSLGGAVALMGARNEPGVRAIVSESSYARLDLMAKELFALPLLRVPLGWLTVLWGKLFLGIDAREVSPMESAKPLRIPILLIHSKDDRVIPFSHALFLQEAVKENPKAEFLFPEHLPHGAFPKAIEEAILSFFLSHISIN